MGNSISVDDSRETDKAQKPHQMVLIECDGVRRVASQDQSGKWKTLNRRKELQGKIEVVKVIR
jgi:hypothetical protein